METTGTYQNLVEEYRRVAEKYIIGNLEMADGKLKRLSGLRKKVIDNIDNLTLEELMRIRQYHDFTEGIFRDTLELTWHEKF